MELQRIKDSNVKVMCCCKLGQLLKSMQNQSKWSPVWQLWKLSLMVQPEQMLQLGSAFSKAAKSWAIWMKGCPGCQGWCQGCCMSHPLCSHSDMLWCLHKVTELEKHMLVNLVWSWGKILKRKRIQVDLNSVIPILKGAYKLHTKPSHSWKPQNTSHTSKGIGRVHRWQ